MVVIPKKNRIHSSVIGKFPFYQCFLCTKAHAFFQISHNAQTMLQDLMHRSYNIDKRLAPAFTYTPVYKDPKHSFKLQFFLGVFTGAIPKLKRTKKSHVFKTLRNTSCRIQNPVLVTFKRMMVGSLGSPTVHSCPAQLIQGIQSTCQ